VIEGLAAADGRLNSDAQHLLQFSLADVIREPLGPQAVLLRPSPAEV